MKHFRVKVCGITRATDAELVAHLGADMLGMIFYKGSRRFVGAGVAREIVGALPPVVSRVGVFVDQKVEEIIRLANRLKLDYVQLHGSEPIKDVVVLRKNGFKVIKAFRISGPADWNRLLTYRADLVLVDNATSVLPGGTGRTFDWSCKPSRRVPNLMLAGGISIENIADGVRRFRPMVVDVNSGVERSPGVKSRVKLKKFFKRCNELRYER